MNEFSNAYETGKLIRYREQAARTQEINNALATGKFALVAQAPTYCPFTDAVTGAARHLLATFDTREAADAAASDHYEAYPAEVDYLVLPELPRTQQPAADFADIPF